MAADASGIVELEVARGVMTATLVDTANRNALGSVLVGALRGALRRAEGDPGVCALVITNQGSTFCAGANLKERSGTSPSASPSSDAAKSQGSGGLVELLQEIQASPRPVIGRIAGHAVGGGVGLAAALDISIAADDVKLGFTEVRLGVVPAMISVVCLPKMRRAEAMEAFLRGHRFTATRAVELGLVNRAVPRAQLDEAVEEVLDDLRQGGPNALGHAKRLVHEVPLRAPAEAFAWTTELSNELFASAEAKEGMRAFLEKRRPAWARAEDPE